MKLSTPAAVTPCKGADDFVSSIKGAFSDRTLPLLREAWIKDSLATEALVRALKPAGTSGTAPPPPAFDPIRDAALAANPQIVIAERDGLIASIRAEGRYTDFQSCWNEARRCAPYLFRLV
jgi:hypothetical protein